MYIWLIVFVVIFIMTPSPMKINPPNSTFVDRPVDAVVYIAMGKLAAEPMVDYAIVSLRKMGAYHGEIYLITDSPSCFDESSKTLDLNVVTVPPAKSLIEIKSMKAKLFQYIPESVKSILYLDVDILVAKSLTSFIRDLNIQKMYRMTVMDPATKYVTAVTNASEAIDFGAFYDCKGHYLGWCAGCEKWHTGVLWMQRNRGSKCMQAWEKILLSGRFDTDQESLDAAEQEGACTHLMPFRRRHLLFAKDYVGTALTSGHTFTHVTGISRPEEQDYFYREMVVPRIRSSMHLPPPSRDAPKQCKIGTGTSSIGGGGSGNSTDGGKPSRRSLSGRETSTSRSHVTRLQ